MELVAGIVETPPGGLDPAEGGRSQASPPRAAGAAKAVPAESIQGASDDALVRAAVAGQREAFGELVRRYTSLVFWYLGSRLADPLDVEEVTQETMVRAYVNLPRLRTPRAFGNWLIAVAGNVLSETRRADSRRVVMDTRGSGIEPAAADGPPERLSREEVCSRLTEEMQRLPAHHRLVLALKHMNGYSVRRIAVHLQIPEGTVRSRLSRAYDTLRRKMEPVMLGARAEPGAASARGGTDGKD